MSETDQDHDGIENQDEPSGQPERIVTEDGIIALDNYEDRWRKDREW